MSPTALLPAAARPGFAAPLALAASALVALVAEQARRVAHARALGRHAPAVYAAAPPAATRRVLLVGDSTGAGVGCEHAHESIAARLARDFPDVQVENLCFNGATVADVLRVVRELPATASHDLVLVFAGGNDVLRCTRWRALVRDVDALVGLLRRRGGRVLWAGMANVGLAPLFLPPFSWWMTARTRRVSRLLAQAVGQAGGEFADFFREGDRCPFAADPARYYARDGVHPSAQAYARCYAQMRPAIAQVLGR